MFILVFIIFNIEMKNLNFATLKPHLISIGIMIVLTIGILNPLFTGKKIGGHDTISYVGMSKETRDFREKTGEEALWTDRMFSGMPTFNISLMSGSNLIKYIDKSVRKVFPGPSAYLVIGMIGFYFLLVSLQCSSWLSLAGAIGFGFCTYMFIIFSVGHNSKAHAMAYIAPVLAGFLMTYRGKRLLGAAIFALIFCLQIYTNHYQVTYYTGISLLVFGFAELMKAIKEKTLPDFGKSTALLIVAAGIAILPNTTRLWGTYDYGKETIRGGKSELSSSHNKKDAGGLDKDYAYAWSYGKMELFNLMIPNFTGAGSGNETIKKDTRTYKIIEGRGGKKAAEAYARYIPTYFGAQSSTSGPVYIGAIIVFLFLLGAIIVPGHIKWALVALTALSLLLALGGNLEWFSDIFFYNFPMYNKFRTPSMILIIAELTMPLLGILGISHLFKNYKTDPDNFLKKVYIAAGTTAGICILFALTKLGIDANLASDSKGVLAQLARGLSRGQQDASRVLDELVAAVRKDRIEIMTASAWKSAGFIIVAGAVLYAVIKEMIDVKIASIAIMALIFIDLYVEDRNYLHKGSYNIQKDYERNMRMNAADIEIKKDKDPHFRVFNLAVNTFNDASTSFYHNHIGGYHAIKLILYQDLIERQIGRNNIDVINMLNGKYIIQETKQGPVPRRNPGALGNAWMIKNLNWVENADAEMNALNKFDPRNEAYADQRYKTIAGNKNEWSQNGTINYIHDEDPRLLKYEFNSADDQFVVFSEIFYKGNKDWKAYIDGQYVDHIRVNYVLRGMNVPAGKHTIEFKFAPKTYYTGETISLIGSILLIAFLAFAIWQNSKQKEETADVAA